MEAVRKKHGRRWNCSSGNQCNSGVPITTPEEVKVSIYNRKGKGTLFVISNLGETGQVVTVIHDTIELGLGVDEDRKTIF